MSRDVRSGAHGSSVFSTEFGGAVSPAVTSIVRDDHRSSAAFVSDRRYNRSMAGSVADSIARLTGLGSGQWGLFTTAQAGAHGVSRLILSRLVDRGVLERVTHGVYAFPAGEDPHRPLRAEWLALVPAMDAAERLDDPSLGVVSHASAAEIHGIGDLLADVPEFTLPGRKQSRRMVRLHRSTLRADEVTVRDGLPVTTVEKTIADLFNDGHDTSHVADAVRDAESAGNLDIEVLSRSLAPLASRANFHSGSELADHLLVVAHLDEQAWGENVVHTSMGRHLYASGALEGLRLASESLRRDMDVRLPDDLQNAFEELSRKVRGSVNMPELSELMGPEPNVASEALRRLRESVQLGEIPSAWVHVKGARPPTGGELSDG